MTWLTVHCVHREDYQRYTRTIMDDTMEPLYSICGELISSSTGIQKSHTVFLTPRMFCEDEHFRRHWIKCGRCAAHDDLALLYLDDSEID